MESGSPLNIIWFCFFIVTILCNILITLIGNQILLPNLEYALTGQEADYLFYTLLLVSAASIFFSLFAVDKLQVNKDAKLPNEQITLKRAILKMAFAEVIGIYGLIFFLVSGQSEKSLLFGAVSLILLLRIYPQKEVI